MLNDILYSRPSEILSGFGLIYQRDMFSVYDRTD